MPFLRPTLSELVSRAQTGLISRLGLRSPPSVAVVRVIGTVLAGLVHGLHGHLDWLSLQIIPDTAEGEYLERWARVFGIMRKPATFATGSLTVEGTAGIVLPVGTTWRAGELEYALDGEPLRTLGADGRIVVSVVCRTPGHDGNLPVGSRLRLTLALAGVKPDATAGEISGGEPEESDVALRARLALRLQNPPQGGAAADYVAWATSVPGITRAWVCRPNLGAVVVLIVSDGPGGVSIPTDAKRREVETFLEERRPVTAQVIVASPRVLPVAVALRIRPDTAEARTSVKNALLRTFARLQPGEDVSVSKLAAAAVTAPGLEDASITVPAANVRVGVSELAIPGEVTWAA
jgi:uncharacterized phage protein gp47/JayE